MLAFKEHAKAIRRAASAHEQLLGRMAAERKELEAKASRVSEAEVERSQVYKYER